MQFRREAAVTYEVLDGHAVLLDPGATKMFTLNPVGTLVWQHLDEYRTHAELVTLILPLVQGVTSEQLDVDIASFLCELAEAGVVATNDEDG